MAVDAELITWIIRGMLLICILATPLAVIILLQSKDGRKKLVRFIMMLAALTAFSLILNQAKNAAPEAPLEAGPEVPIPQSDVSGAPLENTPPLVAPAPPPGWMPPAVTFLFAILLAAVAGLIYWFFLRPPKPVSELQELADEMQEAIDDLVAGADLRQTVIRCYREMNRVVRRSMGLHREEADTPREFERMLIAQGLPPQELSELTRLFEAARYGGQINNPAAKAQAIVCLKQIVGVCRSREVAR